MWFICAEDVLVKALTVFKFLALHCFCNGELWTLNMVLNCHVVGIGGIRLLPFS